MLSLEGCRQRQHRLLQALDGEGLDGVLISTPREIYYFTGLWVENKLFDFPSLLFLGPGQASWLGTWQAEEDAAVDERETYPSSLMATMNPDNHRRLARLASDHGAKRRGALARVGVQAEGASKHVLDAFLGAACPEETVLIDDLIITMQVRKDPDEIECIRAAQQATLAGYARAQEIIEPGVNELDILAECHKAAMRCSGKPHYFGGDFRSGVPGGPARDRPIQEGELFIVDAQSDLDGYWCDLSRTWSVGGKPTDLQQSVFDHIAAILDKVPDMIEPGMSCRELWKELDCLIREHPHLRDQGLIHHGGHGIGLRAHEGPDISSERDATFEVGNAFAVEPGAYSEELRGGVRLEHNYLLTETGLEVLSDFPIELVPKR